MCSKRKQETDLNESSVLSRLGEVDRFINNWEATHGSSMGDVHGLVGINPHNPWLGQGDMFSHGMSSDFDRPRSKTSPKKHRVSRAGERRRGRRQLTTWSKVPSWKCFSQTQYVELVVALLLAYHPHPFLTRYFAPRLGFLSSDWPSQQAIRTNISTTGTTGVTRVKF